MKKAILVLVSVLSCTTFVLGQKLEIYKNKTYIFDFYEQGVECNLLGTSTKDTPIVMPKNGLFTIQRVIADTLLVIKFLNWKENSEKATIYNYETTKTTQTIGESRTEKKEAIKYDRTEKFFAISKAAFDNSCSEYVRHQNWDITFGTLITPFKLRRDPFQFTTNLNLGTSVMWQRSWNTGFHLGLSVGLSLSSIQLDSLSTNGTVTDVSERPAFTPSVGVVLGYKNINFTIVYNGGHRSS